VPYLPLHPILKLKLLDPPLLTVFYALFFAVPEHEKRGKSINELLNCAKDDHEPFLLRNSTNRSIFTPFPMNYCPLVHFLKPTRLLAFTFIRHFEKIPSDEIA
jgi:hypothetical protein